jgi:hypothetical protein
MLAFQIQYDMFDAVPHIATFDIGDRTDVKIFEYSDDLQFDDKMLEDNFIIDVPCYKIEDIIKMLYGDVKMDTVDTYFALAKNKKLNHCLVRISDHKGFMCGDKWYLLANAKTKKYVEQNTIVGCLKGNIKKKLKVYKKCVKIEGIDYRKDIKRNFVSAFVQSKSWTEHVLSQLN